MNLSDYREGVGIRHFGSEWLLTPYAIKDSTILPEIGILYLGACA